MIPQLHAQYICALFIVSAGVDVSYSLHHLDIYIV